MESSAPPEAHELPPIDPAVLRGLEAQSKIVSENLTHLIGGLQAQLFAMTKITLQSVEAYEMGVNNLSEMVDKCVTDTTTLVSKADELNAEMGPIHVIAGQIKDIKRTLDILENACR